MKKRLYLLHFTCKGVFGYFLFILRVKLQVIFPRMSAHFYRLWISSTKPVTTLHPHCSSPTYSISLHRHTLIIAQSRGHLGFLPLLRGWLLVSRTSSWSDAEGICCVAMCRFLELERLSSAVSWWGHNDNWWSHMVLKNMCSTLKREEHFNYMFSMRISKQKSKLNLSLLNVPATRSRNLTLILAF